MILVTGATGQLGRSTIDFLLQKNISLRNISALARSEEKAKELKAKGYQCQNWRLSRLFLTLQASLEGNRPRLKNI